jgi:hypothetical protein
MYDGVADDAHVIPASAQLVAGYVDGLYAWSDAHWARFPNSVKVRIACFADTNDGDVLDCEPGNCTPAQSVDWVLMRRRSGADPTVYCNQLDPKVGWPAVRAAFHARNVAEPHYWVANYSVDQTNPQIPDGAIAIQYTDTGSYDLSAVADHWPGVDPATTDPTAPTTANRRNDMHVDLKLNTPVVFTNPAAVLGGESTMLLACDFGPATVRVATYSFGAGDWTVTMQELSDTGGALSLPLPADINKVSVNLVKGNEAWPVGLDVLA